MISICRVALWIVVQFSVVAAIWLAGVLILRSINFRPNGDRRTKLRGDTPEIRASEKEYHNKAIYQVFAFFLKVALAILGGIAYLSTQADSVISAKVVALTVSGAWLLMLASIIFSIAVFSHQKSVIERWPERYSWSAPFLWAELWYVQGMLLVPAGLLMWVVPILVA